MQGLKQLQVTCIRNTEDTAGRYTTLGNTRANPRRQADAGIGRVVAKPFQAERAGALMGCAPHPLHEEAQAEVAHLEDKRGAQEPTGENTGDTGGERCGGEHQIRVRTKCKFRLFQL